MVVVIKFHALPIVDLFAGPGGLSEGFARQKRDGVDMFDVRLSIEMDPLARQTLMLRSFYRQLGSSASRAGYRKYLRGDQDLAKLFAGAPEAAAVAAAASTGTPAALRSSNSLASESTGPAGEPW